MNTISLNHSYSIEGSLVDKESNIDATRFLKLLKIFNEL